jgi:hypothetical protein
VAYVVALIVTASLALFVGRRAPAQREPEFDHGGFRWRVLHGERFGVSAALQVLVTLFVLWSGWVEILALMWVIAGEPLGWWMIEIPVAASLVAILAVPLLLQTTWTEIDADPVRLRLRRPWIPSPLELPWGEVIRVRSAGQTVIVDTVRGPYHLDAPQASIGAVVAAARWLDSGRQSPPLSEAPREDAPPELVSIVSRAADRSARRADEA